MTAVAPTATPPLALNGHALHSLALHVGELGAWSAECRLTTAPDTMPSAATLRIGDAELRGTIIESQVFGLALGARVVGGAGGWARQIKPRAYHNDAGIKARELADDAAREAGETIGGFVPALERVGADYARRVATAASVLQYAAGGAGWYVDYAGVTHVGARASSTVPAAAYQVLAFDPVERTAQLAVDDFAELVPGRVLGEGLPAPMVVRDIELVSDRGQPVRATVYLGAAGAAGTGAGASRLGGLLQSLVHRLMPDRLHGVYRYRVVGMRGDLRVDLQAVRASVGLPDLQSVEQWPGVPGVAPELTDGVEVLVSFVDGDPAEPLITHYAGPGSNGFVPVGIVIGGESGQPAARQGDSVEVLLPPAVFTGTINALPATGAVSWVMPKAQGTITGGSGKVRVAT